MPNANTFERFKFALNHLAAKLMHDDSQRIRPFERHTRVVESRVGQRNVWATHVQRPLDLYHHRDIVDVHEAVAFRESLRFGRRALVYGNDQIARFVQLDSHQNPLPDISEVHLKAGKRI